MSVLCLVYLSFNSILNLTLWQEVLCYCQLVSRLEEEYLCLILHGIGWCGWLQVQSFKGLGEGHVCMLTGPAGFCFPVFDNVSQYLWTNLREGSLLLAQPCRCMSLPWQEACTHINTHTRWHGHVHVWLIFELPETTFISLSWRHCL